MYEALVVATILGVICFFAYQRVREMTRVITPAPEGITLCGVPLATNGVCKRHVGCSPSCAAWTPLNYTETTVTHALRKGDVITPAHIKTTTYIEDPTLFNL